MRLRLKLFFLAMPVLGAAVIIAWMVVDSNRQHRQKAVQQAALKPARDICWNLLGSYQLSSGVSLTNLEDCLKRQFITPTEYQFLTNHGAIFHAFSWDTTPPDSVVMELFDGEYLFCKSGSAWKKDWKRLIQDLAKNK
jgi:hypothetical protein